MKKFDFSQTKKRTRFFLLVFICIALTLSILTSCDDEDSTEAKLFDAEQALDDGNWEEALAILQSMGTSEEVLQYISNAYAGQVGINTFDLLNTIDELDGENNGTDESGSIDMIGKLIGAENDVLTCSTITGKLGTITDAIYNMTQITDLLGITLDDDQKVQLGLASLTRTVLIIAKLICLDSGEAQITMTEAWIKNYWDTHPGFEISGATWTTVDAELGESYQDMLNNDIQNVAAAVDAMSDGNDIKDDFDQFMSDIDNGQGGGTANDDIISIGELNYYLSEM